MFSAVEAGFREGWPRAKSGEMEMQGFNYRGRLWIVGKRLFGDGEESMRVL